MRFAWLTLLVLSCKPGGNAKPESVAPVPSPSSSTLPALACASCRATPIAVLRRSENLALAADGENVYYVAAYAASVARVPTTGGPRTILATTSTTPAKAFGRTAIAISEHDVYWAHERRKILRVPKAGGEPVEVVPDTGRSVQHIAVRGGDLWWTTFTDFEDGDADVIDVRVSRLVKGATTPASVPLTEWTLVAMNDDTAAVGIDGEKHSLVETSLTTGARVALATGLAPKADVIAIDKLSVYLVEGDALSRVPRGKPGKKQSLGTVTDYVSAVVDAKDLWIVVQSGLWRVPLDGSAARMHDAWGPSWSDRYVLPVVDDSAVYLVIVSGEGKSRARLLTRVLK